MSLEEKYKDVIREAVFGNVNIKETFVQTV